MLNSPTPFLAGWHPAPGRCANTPIYLPRFGGRPLPLLLELFGAFGEVAAFFAASAATGFGAAGAGFGGAASGIAAGATTATACASAACFVRVR